MCIKTSSSSSNVRWLPLDSEISNVNVWGIQPSQIHQFVHLWRSKSWVRIPPPFRDGCILTYKSEIDGGGCPNTYPFESNPLALPNIWIPNKVWFSFNPSFNCSQSWSLNPQNEMSRWTNTLLWLKHVLNAPTHGCFWVWYDPSELKLMSKISSDMLSVRPLDRLSKPSPMK